MQMGGFKPYADPHPSVGSGRFQRGKAGTSATAAVRSSTRRCRNCRGMFGASWFYDPVLDDISPRLAYLRKIPRTAAPMCCT